MLRRSFLQSGFFGLFIQPQNQITENKFQINDKCLLDDESEATIIGIVSYKFFGLWLNQNGKDYKKQVIEDCDKRSSNWRDENFYVVETKYSSIFSDIKVSGDLSIDEIAYIKRHNSRKRMILDLNIWPEVLLKKIK